MRKSELVKLLDENGFYLKRHGKHPIYTDGGTTLPIPSGRRVDRGLSKAIKLQIEKAVERRKPKESLVTSGESV